MAIGLLIVALLVLFMQLLVLREVRRGNPRRTTAPTGRISRTVQKLSQLAMGDGALPPQDTAPYRERMTQDEFADYAERRNMEIHKEANNARHQ